MRTALLISRIWAWFCVGAFFLTLAAFVRHAPAMIAQQAATTREMLDGRLTLESYQARLLLDNKARDLMRRVDTFAAISEQVVRLADTRSQDALNVVDGRLGDVHDLLDQQLTRTNDSIAEVAKLRTDVQPAIEGANLLMRRDALPAQILGLTAATKVTMGQAAKAAISIDQAVPGFIANWDLIGKNVEGATLAASHTSEDTDLMIKRLTPPVIPRWLRLGLAIGVPVAQGGAATATLCVTLGHCR